MMKGSGVHEGALGRRTRRVLRDQRHCSAFSPPLRKLTFAIHTKSPHAHKRPLPRRAHLAPLVESLGGGLDHALAESGAPLSAGQKQLLALARAVLSPAKARGPERGAGDGVG